MPFPEGNSEKVNLIAQLDFKPADYDVAVNHNAKETLMSRRMKTQTNCNSGEERAPPSYS